MRLRVPILAAVVAALCVAAPAVATATENPAHQPPFGSEPLAPLKLVEPPERTPPGFRLSGSEAIAIANGTATVRDERAESPAMKPQASTRGTDRWQIDYYEGGTDVAQVVIDDATGAVVEAWRNQQVEVKLARGYEDAVAGNVSEAWIWIPLCLLFFLPFFDPRRPFRLLHLDLLVLLSFSVSQFFFNKGEIVSSVPLVYPVLAYLFVRMIVAGLRPRTRPGPLIPRLPIRWLLVAGALLLVFRIVLNIVDSQVIDIGFANVVGADRIGDGQGVYDGSFSPLIDRGDSYGPLSYIAYIPFEQLFPWGGGLEELPAAHAAAIVFDLAVVGLLYLAGTRLRAGREGRDLGIALAFAWLAYPYTLYALDANGGNDALVAALLVAALIVFASPLRRGVAIGLGAAVKFGPLALAPLFAAGPGERRVRSTVLFDDRVRRRLGGGSPAASSRGRLPRVLRPHFRLPGVAGVAVQRLGARAVAGLAAGHRSRVPGPARPRPVLDPVAADGAAGGGARRRGPDRHPGRLHALVLFLHPLVDAVRPHQRLRDAGTDHRGPGGDVDPAAARSSLP